MKIVQEANLLGFELHRQATFIPQSDELVKAIDDYNWPRFKQLLKDNQIGSRENMQAIKKTLLSHIATWEDDAKAVIARYDSMGGMGGMRELQERAPYSSCAAVNFDVATRDYRDFKLALQRQTFSERPSVSKPIF